MIEAFVTAVALAIGSPASSEGDLANCLVHLSNAPEYREIGSAELGRSKPFLGSAIGSYCSDEASPLWDKAHERARTQMGLPSKGGPSPGQYEAAKAIMPSMVGEVWQSAQAERANPRPLSDKQRQSMALAWLLDESNAAVLGILEKPLICVGKGAARGEATFSARGVTPNSALGKACGYDAAVDRISAMLSERFPDAPPRFATDTAKPFVEQMALWASLQVANGQ